MKRSGIEAIDLTVGDGALAEQRSIVTIRYDGFLNGGEAFQSDQVSTFRIGARSVLRGLEYGVEGMRVGGQRRIRVSPHLAYGAVGVPGTIPPNALLVFEVQLLAVDPPQPPSAAR